MLLCILIYSFKENSRQIEQEKSNNVPIRHSANVESNDVYFKYNDTTYTILNYSMVDINEQLDECVTCNNTEYTVIGIGIFLTRDHNYKNKSHENLPPFKLNIDDKYYDPFMVNVRNVYESFSIHFDDDTTNPSGLDLSGYVRIDIFFKVYGKSNKSFKIGLDEDYKEIKES